MSLTKVWNSNHFCSSSVDVSTEADWEQMDGAGWGKGTCSLVKPISTN